MPEVKQENSKLGIRWWFPLVILFILVIGAGALLAVRTDDSDKTVVNDVEITDQTVFLRNSGYPLNAPEGYEFDSEIVPPNGTANLYFFKKIDEELQDHPEQVQVTDYVESLSAQRDEDAKSSSLVEITSTESYAQYLSEEGLGRVDLIDYASTYEQVDDLWVVDVSFKQSLADDLLLSTNRRIILDEVSDRITVIDAANPSDSNKFLDLFQSSLGL